MTTEPAAPGPRRPLLELTRVRLLELVREPGAMFWTFGFPLLLTVALGIAFRSQGPERADVSVAPGSGAAELAAALDAEAGLRAAVRPVADAERRLRTGASLVEVVPQPDGGLLFRFDPERPGARAARLRAADAAQRAAGRSDVRVERDQTVSAPGGRYIDWLVPGLLGMQLMSGSMWGMGWYLVEARERKLLKRLVATPMRRSHYLLSYLLMRLVFVLFEAVVLLGFARLSFAVAVRGNLGAVALLSLLGAGSFAGVGLLCASRARNTQTVSGLMNLVMLPMFVVSGVFFASSHFPDALQPVIAALPLTALNDALRAVVNDGAGLLAQWKEMLVMAIWGGLGFGVALRIFRWT